MAKYKSLTKYMMNMQLVEWASKDWVDRFSRYLWICKLLMNDWCILNRILWCAVLA